MKPYYTGADGRDVYDICRQYDLPYTLCNALKYIIRAGKKTPDPMEDLTKAVDCIQREMAYHHPDLYRIPVEDQAEALRRMVKQGGNKDPTD